MSWYLRPSIRREAHSVRASISPVNNPVTVSFAGSTVFTYPSESVGVTLSQSSTNTVQVDFTSAAGPAAQLYWGAWVGAASSFSPSSGTVTFAPGQTTVTIPLTVNPTTVTGCDTTTPCYPSVTITLTKPTNGSPWLDTLYKRVLRLICP